MADPSFHKDKSQSPVILYGKDMKIDLVSTPQAKSHHAAAAKPDLGIVIRKPPQKSSERSLAATEVSRPVSLKSPQDAAKKTELVVTSISRVDINIPAQSETESDGEDPPSQRPDTEESRQTAPEEPPKNYWETSKKSYGLDTGSPSKPAGGDAKADQTRKRGHLTEIPHLLDGSKMLNLASTEDPQDVYSLNLSKCDLEFVIEPDLLLFSNLHSLDVSENALPFARLGILPGLKRLNFSCNGLTSLDLEVDGRFQSLETLDLSFNNIDRAAQIVLATLPGLKYLDLTRNKIRSIATEIHDMTKWRDRVIELILPLHVAALGLDASAQQPAKDSYSAPELADTFPSFIGFQTLETLILEHNPVGPSMDATTWRILGHLPK
ncbi:X-ray radiation resistance-associated protein 1 [Kappamyces sp. JEL0680]|nr:X-ray radiation resistance-associated protein 1 [Kappamyces sp. JEL0680]